MKFLREPRIRAPEIAPLSWAAGEPQLLGELRGRVVLLDFFSFADPEGIRALPHILTLGEHYREAGLSVLGIHVPAYDFERPVESARQEIWRLGIPYPVALDQTFDVFRAYESHDLPARYLVDARGFVRGWHHGPEGLIEAERAIRALLREAHPERELPHILEPAPGMVRPGGLRWLASREIRFGTRGVGFGPPETAGEEESREGETREFAPLPELRAEGRAYLQGTWRLRTDRIVCEGPEGALAVVFEGASVLAVLSREGHPAGSGHEEPTLEVTLDGEPPRGAVSGADLEDRDGAAILPVARGRLYDLISSAEFGIHNLDVRVRGGVAFHLLHFGSADVPEEA